MRGTKWATKATHPLPQLLLGVLLVQDKTNKTCPRIGLACLQVHSLGWHICMCMGMHGLGMHGLAHLHGHSLGWHSWMSIHWAGLEDAGHAIAIALNCACKREPCRRNNLWAPTVQFCLGELSPSQTVNALTRPSIQDSQQYHELKSTAREYRHSLRSSRTMQSSAGENRAGTSVMVFSSERNKYVWIKSRKDRDAATSTAAGRGDNHSEWVRIEHWKWRDTWPTCRGQGAVARARGRPLGLVQSQGQGVHALQLPLHGLMPPGYEDRPRDIFITRWSSKFGVHDRSLGPHLWVSSYFRAELVT